MEYPGQNGRKRPVAGIHHHPLSRMLAVTPHEQPDRELRRYVTVNTTYQQDIIGALYFFLDPP